MNNESASGAAVKANTASAKQIGSAQFNSSESLQDVEVSVYGHVRDSKGDVLGLCTVVDLIREGDTGIGFPGGWGCGRRDLAQAVRDIRREVAALTKQGVPVDIIKKRIKADKERLPGFTMSGVFHVRDASAIRRHTELFCVDLDWIPDEEFDGAWEKATALPYTFLAAISPTGTGIKVGIRLSGLSQWTDSKALPQEEYAQAAKAFHEAAYDTVEALFADLGLKIDPACNDVNRLCLIPYDPEAYVNWKAEPLHAPWRQAGTVGMPANSRGTKMGNGQRSPKPKEVNADRCDAKEEKGVGAGADREELRIRDALEYIDPDPHDNWIKIMFALHRWDPERGYEIWIEWAARSAKFDENEHEEKWAQADPDGEITLGTLFHLARQGGWSGSLTPNKHLTALNPELTAKYGDPFHEEWLEYEVVVEGEKVKRKRLVVHAIKEPWFAAWLGPEGRTGQPAVHSSIESRFFQYYGSTGCYVQVNQQVLENRVATLLRETALACKHPAIDTKAIEFRFTRNKQTSAIAAKAKGIIGVPDNFWDRDPLLLPCKNGALDLGDDPPQLKPHSPKFHFRGLLGADFDPGAKCPKWLDLLRRALPEDDVDLLQRYAGSLLLARNLAQKIMMLVGTPQSGKGVIARVLIRIIGAENVATLRTKALDGRFETSRLVKKVLAYAPDVNERFMSEAGAHLLKAISGEDPFSPEYKSSNFTPPSRPLDTALLITSNSKLKLLLEHDREAWERRLVLIRFDRDGVPEKDRISGYSHVLVAEEGAGILNWMIEGLQMFSDDEFKIVLNERQKAIVDDLLRESESYFCFARERVIQVDSGRLTGEEAYGQYVRFCASRGWAPLSQRRFETGFKGVIQSLYGITRSHDIPSMSGVVRGWRGIDLT